MNIIVIISPVDTPYQRQMKECIAVSKMPMNIKIDAVSKWNKPMSFYLLMRSNSKSRFSIQILS